MKLQHKAWLAVGLLWFAAALNYVDRQVIYSLFPLLSGELGLSSVQLGFLATSFLWIYGLLSPFGGYLADRIGHKRVILASLLVWSAATWLTSLTSGYGQLVATRLLMGVSESLYLPAALALVAALHSDRTRALAVGLHQSGLYAGIVLGGWGGGWIGEHFGWRASFTILGVVGIVYTVVLGGGLASPVATGPVRRAGPFSATAAIILRSRGFLLVLGINGLVSAAYWCVYTWLPLFLFERFGMSLAGAGFAATFYIQAASLAGVLAGGWFADRLATRVPTVRMLTQAAGMLAAAPALFLAAATGSVAPLGAAFVLFGLGRGFYDCNLMPVICQILPEDVRATAYGFLNMVACIMGGIAALGGGYLRETLGLARALEISGGLLLVSGLTLVLTARRVIGGRT